MTDQAINVAIAKECGWKRRRLLNPNAIHAAKSTLTPTEQDAFAAILGALVDGRVIDVGAMRIDTTTRVLFASCRQEAEAFLRVKGLWKEWNTSA